MEESKNKIKFFNQASMLIVVVSTISIFSIIMIFLINHQNTKALYDLSKETVLSSEKMQIYSDLIETARSRTRNTIKLIDTDDLFKQDEINVELDNLAGRFAGLRLRLLDMKLDDHEKSELSKL